MAVGQIISRAIADGAITTSDINDGDITHAKLHTDMDLSAKTLTVPATVRGPATLTIDPAAVGDNTGLVVIAGSLQVDGTTTTINSTTMTVDDKNIVLASGAGNSSAADGAGITIDGASATMLYTHATTSFDFNKPLNISGDLTLTSTDAGSAEDPNLVLYRNSSSPADNDLIGTIQFKGRNDNSQDVIYGEIQSGIQDASDGAEDSSITLQTRSGGSATSFINLSGASGRVNIQKQLFLTTGVDIMFEGATSNANETTLTVTDPTADRTITLPDQSGEVILVESREVVIDGNINVESTSGGSEQNPYFTLRRKSPSPATNDTLGVINFSADNSAAENIPMSQIKARLTDATDGTEDSSLELFTRTNGSIGANLRIDASSTIGMRLLNGGEKNIRFDTGTAFNGSHIDLTPASATGARTITLPDQTGTVVLADSSGNVGIGVASPTRKLELNNGGTGNLVTFTDGIATNFTFKTDGNNVGTFGTEAGSTHLAFMSSGTERVRIDSSGRLLVGKTATGLGNTGHEFGSDGYFYHTRAGDLMWLNRTGSTGTYITFMKDSATIGKLGLESSGLHLDGESSHAGLKLFASSIGPRQNYADVDATIDLGWTGGRFKDIYASGTVYATPGGNDGSSANYAANSANEILNNYGYKPSGLYWIREPNTGTPKQIYCDMETDGGGWMLWLEYNTSTNSMHNQSTARANLGRSYMNNYSKYEVMVDASYVNQINRRSLRGVWELDANGAIRTTGFRNWGEVRIPETVGDPFDPSQDAYFNNGANSEWIQRHQYYGINGASGWSSIGTGSQYVYIREPNPAVKPGTLRSYGGINYEWAYDGTQYGWWIHESSYAVPMFNSLTKNAGFAVTYGNGRRDVFEPNASTGQNSYVNVNNGNNGPGVLGVGKGVLVGEFSIMFNLGYSWGWSEMYIADAVSANNALAQHGSPIANKDQWSISNNSSNNQSYYNWKTSDGVSQATQSGLTPYSFGNYWTWNRQSNGSVYLRNPGGTVYTLGTFFGPMKFFTGAQSPHSTQILNVQSAGRNSTLNAANEQAQTYLRH